jgi:hypothetical protein
MRIAASHVLPAQSLDATSRFYGALGFETLFREDLPVGYLVLRREAVTLPFVRQRLRSRTRATTSFRITVDDVDQCHAASGAVLTARPAAQRLGAICTTGTGREFELTDLDGTALRVCERTARRESARRGRRPAASLG